MAITDKSQRVEFDKNESVHDAAYFLKASLSHVRPENPAVAELIRTEIDWATGILSNIKDLHLIVGSDSLGTDSQVESTAQGKESIAVQSGTTLAIKSSDKDVVELINEDNSLLRITPDVLARTLLNGGVIYMPKT